MTEAYKKLITIAEEELFSSIQALESNDLPSARSAAARAQNLIIEAWQSRAKSEKTQNK